MNFIIYKGYVKIEKYDYRLGGYRVSSSQDNRSVEAIQFQTLVNHMIEYKQYNLLSDYLYEQGAEQWSHPIILAQLAQSYLELNIDNIRDIALHLNRHYLLTPSDIQLRTYSYVHYMNLLHDQGRWMDYFRALSPLLVDLFRLIAEADFLPNIDYYIEPVVKTEPENRQIYKGLHWIQTKIESHSNIIQSTWRKYYGDRFNYSHYVSSSHLIKLIRDHSQQTEVVEKASVIRQVEKDIRNIVAHEAIYVSPELVYRRSELTTDEIHRLIHDLCQLAQLNDSRQIGILNNIDEEIRSYLRQHA